MHAVFGCEFFRAGWRAISQKSWFSLRNVHINALGIPSLFHILRGRLFFACKVLTFLSCSLNTSTNLSCKYFVKRFGLDPFCKARGGCERPKIAKIASSWRPGISCARSSIVKWSFLPSESEIPYPILHTVESDVRTRLSAFSSGMSTASLDAVVIVTSIRPRTRSCDKLLKPVIIIDIGW